MRVLGKVAICGIPYSVIEGNTKEFPNLEDCYGYCDQTASKVILRDCLSNEAFRNTLIHEMQHAVWEHSGLTSFVAERLGVTRSEVEGFEEVFIQMFTPHIIAALSSMKKLRLKP